MTGRTCARCAAAPARRRGRRAPGRRTSPRAARRGPPSPSAARRTWRDTRHCRCGFLRRVMPDDPEEQQHAAVQREMSSSRGGRCPPARSGRRTAPSARCPAGRRRAWSGRWSPTRSRCSRGTAGCSGPSSSSGTSHQAVPSEHEQRPPGHQRATPRARARGSAATGHAERDHRERGGGVDAARPRPPPGRTAAPRDGSTRSLAPRTSGTSTHGASALGQASTEMGPSSGEDPRRQRVGEARHDAARRRTRAPARRRA